MMSHILPLAGKGILITRPQPQAISLCEMVKKNGGETYLFPTLVISPVNDNEFLNKQIKLLEQYDLAIFISVNAAIYSLPFIKKNYLQWPENVNIAAIGDATKHYLEQQGLKVTYRPSNFSSEGLLRLPELQTLVGKRIIIFKGKDGRELLANSLEERGAEVMAVNCYQRECPRHPEAMIKGIVQNRNIHLNTVTSVESLVNFFNMLDDKGREWLKKLPIVVMSERIAEQARSFGLQTIIVAPQSSDEGLMQAMLEWFQIY